MDPLQFGVFLSPRAADIGPLREHVQVAEAAGFDYVSVQDHPYVPDFLDTFALIGTLIGQTSRLRFMTNVANLPLRPAQMLAKISASLDVLSGGRFELGIGAGRAWDQIAGLGGPRRNPREAVAAVSEAIDVLRALWLPDRTASLPGPYYPLTAHTGPAPAHRIGIWLGAVGPHHSGHLGQHHRRIRRRGAVRHHQPGPRAGNQRPATTVRRRGHTTRPRRHLRRLGPLAPPAPPAPALRPPPAPPRHRPAGLQPCYPLAVPREFQPASGDYGCWRRCRIVAAGRCYLAGGRRPTWSVRIG